MKTLYLCFLIVVGAFTSNVFGAGDDANKAAEELQKQFDIKFDSVVIVTSPPKTTTPQN